MSYTINGPTLIGDDTVVNSNTLLGNLLLPSLNGVAGSALLGDMMYCGVNAAGNQTVLPIGTLNQVLTVGPGLVPTWAPDTNAIDKGFMATLSGLQAVAAPATVAATVGAGSLWSVAAAGDFDTTGGWFVGGLVSGIFTPGVIGKYRVELGVGFTNTTSNAGTRTVTLLYNGVALLTKTFQPGGNITIPNNSAFGANIFVSNASHTISVQIVTAGANATNGLSIQFLGGQTFLSIVQYA